MATTLQDHHATLYLKNVLEMSKRIPLTSFGELLSKDLLISQTTERSWYLQEFEGLDEDWLGHNKLFSWRYWNTELKIFYNIFF